MPHVSVVIPLYNKAPYIEAGLRSVQSQSYQNLEIVVVDDGSADGGAALVEAFNDPRIVLIRQANRGAGAARNAGIAAAQGTWIAFLDADDIWEPDKIARQLQAVDAYPELVWAAAAYLRVTEDHRFENGPAVASRLFAAEGVIRDALAVLAIGGTVWTSTLMVRRDVLDEVGGFDPDLRVGQDRELWVRIAIQHPRLAYIDEPLALKRRVDGSLTALSRAQGFSTAPERARRWAEIAKALPPDRASLLRRLARQTVELTARREFIAGRSARAREILRLLPTLGLGTPSWPVKLATLVPAPLLSSFLRIRSRVRRWLLRVYAGLGPAAGASRVYR